MVTLITDALDIALSGWPVFPCGDTKYPAIGKAEGGHGFYDATLDADRVRVLFQHPNARLIGVRAGEASGFDVLDFDYRHGAKKWEDANARRLPETRTHESMSGGRHMLFRHVHGVRNSASKFADGMDVRGEGGYVVVPPSPGYRVISDAEIADWPDWLLEIILARPAAKDERPASRAPLELSSKRLEGLTRSILARVSAAVPGGKHFALRNSALSLGGILDISGMTESEAVERLLEALPDGVKDWNGARATALWGLQRGRDRPLELEDRPRTNGHGTNGSEALQDRPLAEPPPHDPRLPTIRVLQGLRHIAADQGMSAMLEAGVPFYQRDRQMVRAAVSKAKTSGGEIVEVPSLLPVTLPMLSRALGQSAEWERVSKTGEPSRIDPPKEVVEQIASLSGHWPFPPVSGVIGTPTMRPDGSLLTEPGYDAATGLVLVAPPRMPAIPQEPTREQALVAVQRLSTLLTEFPFASAISRSAALSMLLTPVLRGALGAAVPMHVVAAPQAGSGKSYLQDVSSVLATGERCAVITVAPDPNETEKRLIGAAIASFPIIALDNCNGTLSGDFLAQVTERPLLQVRPLGSSGVVRIANVFTVFANGNNIAVAADLVRRTILCTLDANMESPETREFTNDPIAAVLANRGGFLADCLTMARAYHCAGYPNRLPRTPSFERWSDLVRSCLVWLDLADPAGNSGVVQADDPARSARVAIFAGWKQALEIGKGYSTAEIIAAAEEFSSGFLYPDFRNALMEVAKSRAADKIDAMRLGWWLRSTAKIVVGNTKLVVDRSNESHQLWSLTNV